MLLIVEDNQRQQFVYRQLCEKFDYEAVFCSSGEDAIEAIKLTRYAAVLLDLGLPGVNGIEVARALREIERGSERYTPIIVLTANCEPEQREACVKAGVDEILLKPFLVDDFRKMLLRQVYQERRPNLKLLSASPDAKDVVG